MTDRYIITWWNIRYGGQEMEGYETLEAARAALDEFATKYPWNGYSLFEQTLIEERAATAKPTPEFTFTRIGDDPVIITVGNMEPSGG